MLNVFGIWKRYWLIILIGEFVHCQELNTIKKEDCTVNTIENKKCTNCTLKSTEQTEIKMFPPDLGTDITCLYMYNIRLDKLDSQAFQNYQSLTHLYMIYFEIRNFAKDTFSPLKNLLYLNFTDLNWVENTEITWPTTLQILDVTRLPIKTLVAPDLNLLQILNVSETALTEFPTLSELAPLKIIVLHHVKLTNFKVDAIAKYCKLQSLGTLNFTLGDNCQCLQMKTWMNKYNIKATHALNCTPDTNCDVKFSETSVKNRNECLAKHSLNFIFLIIIIVIIVSVLSMAGARYLYQKLFEEEPVEELGITDSALTKQPIEDVEEEATEADDSSGIDVPE